MLRVTMLICNYKIVRRVLSLAREWSSGRFSASIFPPPYEAEQLSSLALVLCPSFCDALLFGTFSAAAALLWTLLWLDDLTGCEDILQDLAPAAPIGGSRPSWGQGWIAPWIRDSSYWSRKCSSNYVCLSNRSQDKVENTLTKRDQRTYALVKNSNMTGRARL